MIATFFSCTLALMIISLVMNSPIALRFQRAGQRCGGFISLCGKDRNQVAGELPCPAGNGSLGHRASLKASSCARMSKAMCRGWNPGVIGASAALAFGASLGRDY